MSDEKKIEFDEVTMPDIEIDTVDTATIANAVTTADAALTAEPATNTGVSPWSSSTEVTSNPVSEPLVSALAPEVSTKIPLEEPTQPPILNIPLPPATVTPPTIVFTPPETKTSTNTNFNIFAEKTQVQTISGTTPVKPASSSVFSEQTIVGSVSNYKPTAPNLRFSAAPPPAPPTVNIDPPVHIANEVTFKPEPEDTIVKAAEPKFAFKMPNIRLDQLPKVELSRKNIAIAVGAIAIALLMLQAIFSSHANKTAPEPAAVVARNEKPAPVAKTREISSQTADTRSAQIIHQTANDFLLHFRASVEKNQNFGRESTSP